MAVSQTLTLEQKRALALANARLRAEQPSLPDQAKRTYEGEPNFLGDLAEGIREGGRQFTYGLFQTGFEAAGNKQAVENLQKMTTESRERVEGLRKDSPEFLGVTAVGAGEAIGADVAPFIAVPAGRGIKGMAALGAASGAGYGLTKAEGVDEERNRLLGALGYGAVGAALPVAISGVGAGVKAIGRAGGEAAQTLSKYTDIVSGKIDPKDAVELAKQGIDVNRITAAADDTGRTFINNYLRNTVLGGGKIRKAAERVEGQVGQAFQRTIGQGADPVEAGLQIQSGLKSAKNAFFNTSEKLFDDVTTKLNPKSPVFARQTVRLLDETNDELVGTQLGAVIGGAKQRAYSDVADIVGEIRRTLGTGGLTYPKLKAVRTEVGKLLRKTPRTSDSYGQYAQLYGALSDDLFKAAEEFGGDALLAAQRANKFYRSGIQEIEFLDKSFGLSKSAEDAFQAAVSNLQNKGQKLDRLLKQIPTANRRQVVGSVLNRLGQQGASPETFDTLRFASNFEKLSPAAKSALFRGSPEHLKEVSMLVRNIERARPLLEAAPRTGEKAAGVISDIGAGALASAGLFNPVLFLPAIAKAIFDVKGADLLTKPVLVRAMNSAAKAKSKQEMFKLLDDALIQSGNTSTRKLLNDIKKQVSNQRGSIQLGDKLPIDTASRMQRAREMGFDVDNPVYHGTGLDIKEFDVNKSHWNTKFGNAVYTTKEPYGANYYAGMKDNGNVIKGFTSAKNFFPADKQIPITQAEEIATKTSAALDYIKEAKKRGQNNVEGYILYRNLHKELGEGKLQSELQKIGYDGVQYLDERAIFDPKNIRSVNAKFDPSKANSADLLASPATVTALAGALAFSAQGNNLPALIAQEPEFAVASEDERFRKWLQLTAKKTDAAEVKRMYNVGLRNINNPQAVKLIKKLKKGHGDGGKIN